MKKNILLRTHFCRCNAVLTHLPIGDLLLLDASFGDERASESIIAESLIHPDEELI